jgi:hypothetical protein
MKMKGNSTLKMIAEGLRSIERRLAVAMANIALV